MNPIEIGRNIVKGCSTTVIVTTELVKGTLFHRGDLTDDFIMLEIVSRC